MDDALQAAMLFPKSEPFPDLWATTLDEVFAVGVGQSVVDLAPIPVIDAPKRAERIFEFMGLFQSGA